MRRTGILARLAAGLAGVGLATLMVALALLTSGMNAPAMAATTASPPAPPAPPSTPPGAGLNLAAVAATPPTTITTAYSCDLSGYGSGLTPAKLSATLTIPATVVANSALDVTLTTTASDALPSAVATALAGVTSFDLTGQVTQEPGNTVASPNSAPIALAGTATTTGTLTAVPAVTATGSGKFLLTDPSVVVAPATTLTITPHTSSAALAAITCTTTAAAQNVKVTVTPETVGVSGPLYSCVESVTGITVNTVYVHIPSLLTAAGTPQVGKTDTVTYATGAWGIWPSGTTSVEFQGALPVSGAQPGQIAIKQSVDPGSPVLKVSGKLTLTKAGTDHVLTPEKFTIQLGEAVQSETVTETVACTMTTTPAPVGLTLAVKKASGGGPHPTISPTPSHTASATPTPTPTPTATQTGIPTGGADTGGGTGTGVSLGVVAAGGAIAVSGGGLLLFGRRQASRHSRASRN